MQLEMTKLSHFPMTSACPFPENQYLSVADVSVCVCAHACLHASAFMCIYIRSYLLKNWK